LSIAGREGNFNVSVSAYKKFFQIKMWDSSNKFFLWHQA
jgi:hypothetical protein